VAVCLLVLGVGAIAVVATWGARTIKRHLSQDFIEIFGKIKGLPTIEKEHIIEDAVFPSVKFENMSAPIMQATDIRGRKFYAVKIHVISKDKTVEAKEVLIVYQREPLVDKSWVVGGHGNIKLILPFFVSSTSEGKIGDKNKDKYDHLKQLINDKHLEWNGIVYDL